MKTPMQWRHGRGVTLIEVLVALVVTSIGLLGVAKMQALAIAATRTSSARSLIAIEASSMASAMHANAAYWRNVSLVGVTYNATVSGAAITGSSDATLLAQGTNCQAVSCAGSPVAMAAFDLAGPNGWGAALQNVSPTATGTIECTGSPAICTIFVTWTENMVNMNNLNTATGQTYTSASPTQQVTFSMMVQP